MAILRDIRRRITSVRNTRQITSAMKMVSAAKLNRAQNAVRVAQPYSDRLLRMVSALHASQAGEEHPLFTERDGGKSLVLLFTTDRGLCGNFNNNLCRYLLPRLSGGALRDPELIVFGRKGNDFFKRRGFAIGKAQMFLHSSEYPDAIGEVMADVMERFLAGEVGRVFLAYNLFHSPIRQQPEFRQLVPIPPLDEEEGALDKREMLFEPSREEILDYLLPAFLRNQTLVAHLNSEAGEHGARMVAMEGATKNAGEMIARLTLTYNRARQAAITKELIEIVNAAQAL